MGIEFVSLSKGSRELIAKIVQQRVHQGLGDSEDIPHALEEEPELGEAEEAPVQARAPASAPDNLEKLPEKTAKPERSKRLRAAELTLTGLDDTQLDLSAALRRARELVGTGSADSELDQLFRVSAAPIAETVDDASHKLARILGGKAVRGKRLRHRDPPTDHAALADLDPNDVATPVPQGDRPVPAASVAPLDKPVAAAIVMGDDDIDESRDAEPETMVGPEPEPDPFPAIEDELGDFRDRDAGSPTAVSMGLDSAMALDDALNTLGERSKATPEASASTLDSALSSLELDESEESVRSRAETDEEPLVISDEYVEESDRPTELSLDDELELDMLEDEEGAVRGVRAATSAPNGIDVDVLDPGGLEDNGIYELSKPGSSPVDLISLADLPSSRGNSDEDDLDAEIEFDLPD